ncbi:MAG: hypothetical protein AAGK21_16395 [Bacteroidota bacterium]
MKLSSETDEDGDELARLVEKLLCALGICHPCIDQKLNPKLSLISLFHDDAQLRHELSPASCSTGSAVIRSH